MSNEERSAKPAKQDAFRALMREGWTSLHFDARCPGVEVPDHLRGEPHLVLQYGHDLPIPITDLGISEDGVRATLSFSRTPHATFVPWAAVYIITGDDGQGFLYREDVPPEVAVLFQSMEQRRQGTAAENGADRPDGGRSMHLCSVPLDAEGAGAPPESAEVPAPRRRRRPQLRLVK